MMEGRAARRKNIPPTPPGEENANFSLTAPRRVLSQFDKLCEIRNWSRSYGMRYLMEQEVIRSKEEILQGLQPGANQKASQAAFSEVMTPTTGASP